MRLGADFGGCRVEGLDFCFVLVEGFDLRGM